MTPPPFFYMKRAHYLRYMHLFLFLEKEKRCRLSLIRATLKEFKPYTSRLKCILLANRIIHLCKHRSISFIYTFFVLWLAILQAKISIVAQIEIHRICMWKESMSLGDNRAYKKGTMMYWMGVNFQFTKPYQSCQFKESSLKTIALSD